VQQERQKAGSDKKKAESLNKGRAVAERYQKNPTRQIRKKKNLLGEAFKKGKRKLQKRAARPPRRAGRPFIQGDNKMKQKKEQHPPSLSPPHPTGSGRGTQRIKKKPRDRDWGGGSRQ